MAQESPKNKKRKRKLPKDALEHDDRHLMECVFGKRFMKAVDKVLADCPEGRRKVRKTKIASIP